MVYFFDKKKKRSTRLEFLLTPLGFDDLCRKRDDSAHLDDDLDFGAQYEYGDLEGDRAVEPQVVRASIAYTNFLARVKRRPVLPVLFDDHRDDLWPELKLFAAQEINGDSLDELAVADTAEQAVFERKCPS